MQPLSPAAVSIQSSPSTTSRLRDIPPHAEIESPNLPSRKTAAEQTHHKSQILRLHFLQTYTSNSGSLEPTLLSRSLSGRRAPPDLQRQWRASFLCRTSHPASVLEIFLASFPGHQVEGGWPWFHTAHYQVEGAHGPSPLETGERGSSCLLRIHAGSCQPLSRAVPSDSISTVPCIPV
jgi:hypothetical protein